MGTEELAITQIYHNSHEHRWGYTTAYHTESSLIRVDPNATNCIAETRRAEETQFVACSVQ